MKNVTNVCWVKVVYHVLFCHSGHRNIIKHSSFHALFCVLAFRITQTHVEDDHVSLSRAWGTLSLGILLALILGLIARVPQSNIVLIAAIRCIGIRSSAWTTRGLLLRVLLVTVRLLILLRGLGVAWLGGVLALVI